MITINATGDTTLHTAGKYCAEDILVKVPAGGSGGSGDATVETCTVTMNLPSNIAVIGYGTCDLYYNGTKMGTFTNPGTNAYSHGFSLDCTRIFNDIPVGSVFTFCTRSGGTMHAIKGASVTDNIEFSFVNTNVASATEYYYAVCRCNGDGEITITI